MNMDLILFIESVCEGLLNISTSNMNDLNSELELINMMKHETTSNKSCICVAWQGHVNIILDELYIPP